MACQPLIAALALLCCMPIGVAQQRLFSPTPAANARFGRAVSAAGELLVVGAPYADTAGVESGAVDVFVRVGGALEARARLVGSAVGAGHRFGGVVHTDGVRIVVGAPNETPTNGRLGAVYVFEEVGGVWTEVAQIQSVALDAADGFGRSVGVSGDLVVVGAPFEDRTSADSGAVHTFDLSSGVPLWTGAFVAPDTGPSDRLGWALDLEGSRLVVSAVNDDDRHVNAGAAYVLARVGSVWSVAQKLVPSTAGPNDFFGSSLDLGGGLIGRFVVAGVPSADVLGVDSGRAVVFEEVGGAWYETARLEPADGAAGDAFGASVAVSAGHVLVGSSHADVFGVDSGKAYSFEPGPLGWELARTLAPPVGAPADYFGLACTMTAELAFLGAFGDDARANRAGAVYVYDAWSLSEEWARPFCFCPGGSSCGNLDLDAGCNNSTGRGALLAWSGSPSLLASDLAFTVHDLPADTSTIVFMGDATAEVVVGDGRVCAVAGPRGVHRIFVSAADGLGVMASLTDVVGAANAKLGPSAPIQPGETWHFQTWYRDVRSICGSHLNTSSALAVTFAP